VLQSSPTTQLAAQAFLATWSLEALLFPVSCSVEHALAAPKWSAWDVWWLVADWRPVLSQLQWAGFGTAPCALSGAGGHDGSLPGLWLFSRDAGSDASGGITKQSPQYLSTRALPQWLSVT